MIKTGGKVVPLIKKLGKRMLRRFESSNLHAAFTNCVILSK